MLQSELTHTFVPVRPRSLPRMCQYRRLRTNPRRTLKADVWRRNLRVLVCFKYLNPCLSIPVDLTWYWCSHALFRLNTYKINTASYHFTTFAFLPLLAAAKTVGGSPEPGNIVNLSSMSGITKTSQRGQFNYNAGKWVRRSFDLAWTFRTKFFWVLL